MPFLVGLATGMIVSSIGGLIALRVDTVKNTRKYQASLKSSTPVPVLTESQAVNHYHITLDEMSELTLPVSLPKTPIAPISPPSESPIKESVSESFAKALGLPPVDKNIDWRKAFEPKEAPHVRNEKREQSIEAPCQNDSANNSDAMSPSRARAQKRARKNNEKSK